MLESTLHDAGFATIRWAEPAISPEGIAQFGAESWREIQAVPPRRLIECANI